MRAEHAAVHVRLVDDYEREIGEHVAPARVVWQHAHVEHVRVGQDQVRALADGAALLARRVPVVDRVAQERRAQLVQLARLVLRERLGRVDVDRPRPRIARQRVEHRQVERQRLAARGAGRDDRRVLPRRLERCRLVRPELVDAGALERLEERRVQVAGNRLRLRRPGAVAGGPDEPFVGSSLLEDGGPRGV
jgi:hypothetical protein